MWMSKAPCEDKQKHTWKEPAFASGSHLYSITLPQPPRTVRMSGGKFLSLTLFLWKTTLFLKLHKQLCFSDLVKAKKGTRKSNDNSQ